MSECENEVEDETMLVLALELLDSPQQEAKIPGLLNLTTEDSQRVFAAMYSSRNTRLFRDHFRMNREVFDLLHERCLPFLPPGVRDSREVIGVVLDWLGNGTSCRKQEVNFDLSYSTVHGYRIDGLKAILRSLHNLIMLPTAVPPSFKHKYPYFDQAICAIDGAHFPLLAAKDDAERFRNRKGWISTNALVASDWKLRVCFANVGAEGSAHDATVLQLSRLLQQLPENYYVIADAGYGLSSQVLTPYRSVRYHLKKWAKRPEGRPQTPQELFNLRHAKASVVPVPLSGTVPSQTRLIIAARLRALKWQRRAHQHGTRHAPARHN